MISEPRINNEFPVPWARYIEFETYFFMARQYIKDRIDAIKIQSDPLREKAGPLMIDHNTIYKIAEISVSRT